MIHKVFRLVVSTLACHPHFTVITKPQNPVIMSLHSFKPTILLVGMLLPTFLHAIPDSVFPPVFAANSPLNGEDITPELIAAAVWKDGAALPGTWQNESRIAAAEVSHLLARPKVFGREVVLLRAIHRDGRLMSLDATFADAGSFFGYFDEKLPEDLDRRAQRKELELRVSKRQTEFAEMYVETLESLHSTLAESAKPRSTKMGHTRTLRAETQDYIVGDLTFRLLAADQRLIRVTIARSTDLPDSWLDPDIAVLDPRERLKRLQQSVVKSDDGTVSITGLQPVPQGYRPYCGLNSLAIASRHFGLHIDEDWLAVAGGFKNTGSADGSNILRLYSAVAAEAGLSVIRSTKFDETAIKRALADGLPVVVWRRFSYERDQVHTQFARTYAQSPAAVLADPSNPAERESWPNEDAPLHASVLMGYHEERGEFLFLESWSGRDKPRRMRTAELDATAYLSFVFQP
jgi:hypothetical protein